MIKNILSAACLICALQATAFAPDAAAQDSDTMVVAVLDYMKVTGGDAIALETEWWKPVHQARANAGDVNGWWLMSTPYTVDRSYDYVTINTYRGWSRFEQAWSRTTAIVDSLYPAEQGQEMMDETSAARDIVKTEVWLAADWTGDMHQSAAAMVSFFQVPPGGWDDYARLESTFWKPMHEMAIAAGSEDAWWMIRLAFPGGVRYGYNAATMNFIPSLSQAMNMPWASSFLTEAHPNLEWDDLSHMTLMARKDVGFELWTLVDHVHTEE